MVGERKVYTFVW